MNLQNINTSEIFLNLLFLVSRYFNLNTFLLLTQSSHDPLGFLVLYGSRRLARVSQAFCTAAPFKSEEAEAAVGLVFGTVLVLVSEMWIFAQGIPKTLLAT